jgi:predicted ATPase
VITTFRAKNYGCLLDVTAHVTPLHAFIGPNDSGKSTLLNGMRTLVQLASSRFELEDGKWAPFDPFLGPHGYPPRPGMMLACAADTAWYSYADEDDRWVERICEAGADGLAEAAGSLSDHRPPSQFSDLVDPRPDDLDPRVAAIDRQLRSARLARFDPDALRAPSGLIPETARVDFLDERGRGLAGVYFAIRNRNDDTFATIVTGVRKHFPTIKGLRVKAVTSAEVVLEAELTTGARVEAARMSEGLLYYLAFAALRHIDPVSLLLVEEPENGLHPARIAEVVRILRAIVEETGTQVILATHSPLVVNELRPEEVSVVTRSESTGTRVTRIHETPDFAERAKVYALGELWIAYANGEDERPLLTGTEP